MVMPQNLYSESNLDFPNNNSCHFSTLEYVYTTHVTLQKQIHFVFAKYFINPNVSRSHILLEVRRLHSGTNTWQYSLQMGRLQFARIIHVITTSIWLGRRGYTYIFPMKNKAILGGTYFCNEIESLGLFSYLHYFNQPYGKGSSCLNRHP